MKQRDKKPVPWTRCLGEEGIVVVKASWINGWVTIYPYLAPNPSDCQVITDVMSMSSQRPKLPFLTHDSMKERLLSLLVLLFLVEEQNVPIVLVLTCWNLAILGTMRGREHKTAVLYWWVSWGYMTFEMGDSSSFLQATWWSYCPL